MSIANVAFDRMIVSFHDICIFTLFAMQLDYCKIQRVHDQIFLESYFDVSNQYQRCRIMTFLGSRIMKSWIPTQTEPLDSPVLHIFLLVMYFSTVTSFKNKKIKNKNKKKFWSSIINDQICFEVFLNFFFFEASSD